MTTSGSHLDHSAARFQLYELDAATLDLAEVDCSDRGNIATRLVQCPDSASLRRRFTPTRSCRVVWTR